MTLEDLIDFFKSVKELKKMIDDGKIFFVLFVLSIFGVFFHYNGGKIDPHNIILYVSILFLTVSSIGLIYRWWVNRYLHSDLSVPYAQDKNYDYLNKIFVDSMNKYKFQYIGVYNIKDIKAEYINQTLINISDFSINEIEKSSLKCDRYAKNDFHENFKKVKVNIFCNIYNSTQLCNESLGQLINNIHPEKIKINTLRFVYDLHPGGAFIFADPQLFDKNSATEYPNLRIVGYTNKQKNVNICTKEMGYIVDKIRKNYNLQPITNVDE